MFDNGLEQEAAQTCKGCSTLHTTYLGQSISSIKDQAREREEKTWRISLRNDIGKTDTEHWNISDQRGIKLDILSFLFFFSPPDKEIEHFWQLKSAQTIFVSPDEKEKAVKSKSRRNEFSRAIIEEMGESEEGKSRSRWRKVSDQLFKFTCFLYSSSDLALIWKSVFHFSSPFSSALSEIWAAFSIRYSSEGHRNSCFNLLRNRSTTPKVQFPAFCSMS